MEEEIQNQVQQPSENLKTEQLAPFSVQKEETKLGRRKFTAPKPKTSTYSGGRKQNLDELKVNIIQLANKNFDSTMYIIRSWCKSSK